MTERELVVTGLLLAGASFAAVATPWWVIGAAVLVATATRRPVVVMATLCLLVGTRAHDAMAALEGERAGVITATVTVLSDPIVGHGRWSFDVRLGRERDVAELPLEIDEPEVGERLVVRGEIRTLPAEGWVVPRHLRARLRIERILARRPPSAILGAVNGFRAAVLSGAVSLDGQRPLFAGIVLGDDRGQPAVQVHRFRVSGLSHLLAVSGQNVAFVLLVIAPALSRLGLRGRWALSVGVLGFFVLVTRAEPSVLRAVAMALIAVTARLRGRGASSLRVLCLAVIALSVADPLLWRSVGFQLSVAATTAIIVVQPWLVRRLAGPRWFRISLSTVLAAQAATLPLLLSIGSVTSSVSILANLAAVPVAGAVMVWGLTAGVVAAVVPDGLADLLHLPTRAMLWWIDAVAGLAASPRWPTLGAALAVPVGAGLLAVLSGRRRLAVAGRLTLAGCLCVACLPPSQGSWRCAPGVTARRDSAGAAVVTASGRSGESQILVCLGRHRLERVDLLVLTSTASVATRQAAAVRDTARVDTVIAPPGLVRDAHPIRPGTWRVGNTTVSVERRRDGWSVKVG